MTEQSTDHGSGVLEILPDGFGFLRDPGCNYLSGPDDIYVSPSQIRRFDLRTGDLLAGQVRAPKDNERYPALIQVEEVNGADPDRAQDTIEFDSLTPLHPEEQLRLEMGPKAAATRLMDLLTPVGKGQRGLIAAPPRTGRTVLLQQVSQAVSTNHPEVHQIVLLIDERPEEVTDMQRSVQAEVVSSTFDEPPTRHVQVAEMVVERARRLVENGQDVLILLDSLTHLVRAYNSSTPPSGKILAGGLDATALHPPKRFFGAARNVEEGGSLTILATVLVDTGSSMDEVIYEELKATANLELVLDPQVAQARLFPAMNPQLSGTQREDLLLDEKALRQRDQLRAGLSGNSVEDIATLLDALKRWSTNEELLDNQGSTGQ